jgi:beta-lactamase superfamily II metal-dependent hydrolase
MVKLHMLQSVANCINTSFIFQTDNALVVIDGGRPEEAENLYSYIKKLGGTVDAWFLTHAHDDHISALFTILNTHDDITVKKAYFNFPSAQYLSIGEPKQAIMTTPKLLDTLYTALDRCGVERVTTMRGDKYSIGGLDITVLLHPDESIPATHINRTSCVFRFEVNGKSVLFLGDLDEAGGRELLEVNPPKFIKADYVQMAHHGQAGVDFDVYQAIAPSYCLWCTPTWLWDNLGDGGYDTGPFKTVIVRGWMSSLRTVKKHYLMMEGPHVIEI